MRMRMDEHEANEVDEEMRNPGTPEHLNEATLSQHMNPLKQGQLRWLELPFMTLAPT